MKEIKFSRTHDVQFACLIKIAFYNICTRNESFKKFNWTEIIKVNKRTKIKNSWLKDVKIV